MVTSDPCFLLEYGTDTRSTVLYTVPVYRVELAYNKTRNKDMAFATKSFETHEHRHKVPATGMDSLNRIQAEKNWSEVGRR